MMKRYAITAVAVTAMAVGMAACSKGCATSAPTTTPTTQAPGSPEAANKTGTPTTPTAPTGATLTPDVIAGSLSKAVCAAMTMCEKKKAPEAQQPVSEADCTTSMSKDLAQSLPDKARTITQVQLDACVQTLAKLTQEGNCAVLTDQQAPQGCEFMN